LTVTLNPAVDTDGVVQIPQEEKKTGSPQTLVLRTLLISSLISGRHQSSPRFSLLAWQVILIGTLMFLLLILAHLQPIQMDTQGVHSAKMKRSNI